MTALDDCNAAIAELRLTDVYKKRSSDAYYYSTHTGKAELLMKHAVGLLAPISTPPTPPPPPPTPTPTTLKKCLVPNGGFPGTYGDKVKSLQPYAIREDNLSAALVQWAADNNIAVLGLGGPLTNTLVDQYPTINFWEYDNEPYFRSVNLASYAITARDYAKQFKVRYPDKKLIFPCLVQTNGGDYNTNGVWSPWVKQVWDAAPDIGNYFHGVGVHPYSPNRNGDPSSTDPAKSPFPTIDKVHSQLIALGFDKPWYCTEVGYSVGTRVDQVTEVQQADYMNKFFNLAKQRSYIKEVYWYCLRSWPSTNIFEGQFGLFKEDGSERPAAATFRLLA